ncbi:hypothetical protein D3C79_585890 [compost metagenome]
MKMEPFIKPVLVKEEGTGYEYVVEESTLQPIAQEVFNLGDKVKLINGEYRGKVVGFEPHVNKVITEPSLLKTVYNEHLRYSHSPNLLEKISEDVVYIDPGKFYKANSKTLLAVELESPTHVALVNSRGVAIHKDLPKAIKQIDLQLRFGISEIKQTSMGEWTI